MLVILSAYLAAHFRVKATQVAEQARRRLARMFEDHAPVLRGFFLRRGARQDAEDLVQETYLRLLRAHEGNGEPIANPEAYLFTVAQNLAREQAARRRWSTLPIEEIEDLGQSLASGECTEDAAEREQRSRYLQTLLATLPEHTRAVLVMQYRDGLSYKQIAERMGVSPHMVKKHVVRGLSVCRRAMAEPAGRP
ncbi:ECF RNA polymerase sigma factor SigE [compost metagenome]